VTEEKKYVLYMLHFPNKVGRCRHYVGITQRHLLRQRLRHHLGGFGARLTNRASLDNPHIFLVALWPRSSFEHERIIKGRGNYKMYCRLCTDRHHMRQPKIRHLEISMSRPKHIEHSDRRSGGLSWKK
jgi:hypothetical protein